MCLVFWQTAKCTSEDEDEKADEHINFEHNGRSIKQFKREYKLKHF